MDILTASDFNSPTWLKLERIMKQRLEDARILNDQPRAEEETAHIRGRIAELKFFIAQPTYLQRREEAARQEIEPGDISAIF